MLGDDINNVPMDRVEKAIFDNTARSYIVLIYVKYIQKVIDALDPYQKEKCNFITNLSKDIDNLVNVYDNNTIYSLNMKLPIQQVESHTYTISDLVFCKDLHTLPVYNIVEGGRYIPYSRCTLISSELIETGEFDDWIPVIYSQVTIIIDIISKNLPITSYLSLNVRLCPSDPEPYRLFEMNIELLCEHICRLFGSIQRYQMHHL